MEGVKQMLKESSDGQRQMGKNEAGGGRDGWGNQERYDMKVGEADREKMSQQRGGEAGSYVLALQWTRCLKLNTDTDTWSHSQFPYLLHFTSPRPPTCR